jgi:hypothetical protein
MQQNLAMLALPPPGAFLCPSGSALSPPLVVVVWVWVCLFEVIPCCFQARGRGRPRVVLPQLPPSGGAILSGSEDHFHDDVDGDGDDDDFNDGNAEPSQLRAHGGRPLQQTSTGPQPHSVRVKHEQPRDAVDSSPHTVVVDWSASSPSLVGNKRAPHTASQRDACVTCAV